MITVARAITLLATTMLILMVGGCTTTPPGSDTGAASPPPEPNVKRFQNTPVEGRTAVESALELSEKYARLSDQMVTLRQENQRLTSENENLRQQVVTLEARLTQTQKELNEANELLIEMLSELNNWKNNILGFRGEMRQAAQAQLEALLKVLEILGGEIEAGNIGGEQPEPPHQDVNDMTAPETPLEGEPNELQ